MNPIVEAAYLRSSNPAAKCRGMIIIIEQHARYDLR